MRIMKKILLCVIAAVLCILSVCTGVLAAPSDWTNAILGNTIEKAEPQDDFYAYVNADWMQNVVFPEGYSNVSTFSEMDLIIRDRMIALLESDEAGSHEAALAQTYYRLMLDMDKRNADGVGMLVEEIEEIEAIDSIEALNAYLLDPACTQSVLLRFDVFPDLMDSTLNVAFCSEVSFLLGDSAEYTRRTAHGDRIDAANSYVMREMFAHIGRSGEEGEALYRLALELEGKLAPHVYTVEDQYGADYYQNIYNIYDAEALQQLNHAFPLQQLVEARGMQNSPFFVITLPEYHAVCDAMYTQDNLEAIKALLICKQVLGATSALDQASLDIDNQASVIRSGATGSVSPQERAYTDVSSMLPGALGRMYVEAYLSEETRQDVFSMINQITAVYRSRLEKADWLSAETREQAIEKLDSITAYVGKGNKWGDYSALQVDPDASLYEAISGYRRFLEQRNAAKAGTRVDPDEWDSASHESNAYYMPQDNSISLFAGILLPPFYTPGGSYEANLGGIGTVIGHEITHAFDAGGSQFDADGNLVNWWTEEDYAAFTQRADKVSDYFSSVEVQPGLPVNGILTQGEAVADMGGVSAALEIARNIEGFDYEIFFETYAKLWAVLHTQESMEMRVHADPHPLGYLRCNITLQQFDEFHETYGVQEGDGMYLAPEARLSVW